MLNKEISQDIIDAIVDQSKLHTETTLALLEEIVNIDSFSHDKEDVEKAYLPLIKEIQALGMALERVPQPKYADQLISSINKAEKNILITGHVDTVFVAGTVKDRPFTVDSSLSRCYGPGVADMKGGVAITIAALQILKKLDLLTMPIEVIFTGDEELGSPSSGSVISELAKRTAVSFTLEAGRPDGSVIVKRSGSGHATINITGLASHSGLAYDDGISANLELAHKMLALDKLNDSAAGRNVNSGIISGGASTNMVSPQSSMNIHFTFTTMEDGFKMVKDIQAIADHSYIEGTNAEIEIRIGCVPMEKNEANNSLFEMVHKCAQNINYNLKGTSTKGASDAGHTSVAGCPSICAMGPVGGGFHTPDEYVEIDSIPVRTALLALSILEASKKYFG